MNGIANSAYCFVRAVVFAACAPALSGCFYEEYEVVSEGALGCAEVGSLTPIACGQAQPTAIAVDGANIYWTNEGSGEIMATSKTVGGVAPLVTGEDRPCGIAAVKQGLTSYIYWRTRGGSLKRMSVGGDGETPEVLESNLGDSCLLVTDFAEVFYFRRPLAMVNELIRRGPTGQEVQIAATPRPSSLSVANTDRIAWVDAAEKKAYVSPKTLMGAKASLNAGEPCGVSIQAAYVVVTSMTREEVSFFEFFMGSPSMAVVSKQPTPCLITSDNQGLYWLSDADGTLRRRLLSGQGQAEIIATGPVHPCAVTSDDENVYWTTCDSNGMIMSAPK